MSLVDVPGGILFPSPIPLSAGLPALAAMSTVNDANDKIAYIIQVPKSGTLDWFECQQFANTNNPDNGLRFSFQSLSATTGAPGGVQDQFRTLTSGFGNRAWLVPPGVMTNDGTNGGTKRTVTVGDWIACVVEFESFTAGDSVSFAELNLSTGASGAASPTVNQYVSVFETAWINAIGAGPIALKYSDGTYGVLPLWWSPMLTINSTGFNSGSSPANRGIRFKNAFPCRVAGMWVRFSAGDANYNVTLYDNADNILSQTLIDGNFDVSAGGNNTLIYFDTKVDLAANTIYRLIISPTAASPNVTLYDFDVSVAALMAAVQGGVEWYSSNGTTGAWVDSTANRAFMGLIIDAISDGIGGGSGGVFFG